MVVLMPNRSGGPRALIVVIGSGRSQTARSRTGPFRCDRPKTMDLVLPCFRLI